MGSNPTSVKTFFFLIQTLLSYLYYHRSIDSFICKVELFCQDMSDKEEDNRHIQIEIEILMESNDFRWTNRHKVIDLDI